MASPSTAPHPPHTPPTLAASPLPVHESQGNSQEHTDIDMSQTSRDATSTSPSTSMSASASASASSPRSAMEGIVEEGVRTGDEEADVEKLLKKVELEKKIHQLQRRLELASVKANNGWTDMSIKDIEHKQLPATPSRSKPPLSVHTSSPMGNPLSSSPSIPYEPPSPSRPWQLIDVLWQPLPPPSHGNYPPSPSSPMKRSREDDHPEAPRPSGHGFSYPMALASPGARRVNGHRRASSSLSGQTLDKRMLAGPSSPLRTRFEGPDKKKRSHSHSTHHRSRRDETTSQDVDAAKALTFMLSSGSSDDGGGSMSRQSSSEAILPVPDSFASPIPTSPTARPRRLSTTSNQTTPRAADLRTPNSHARSRLQPGSGSSAERDRPEEDKTAAELMMFLAHSPSPMKSAKRGAAPGGGAPDSPSRPSLGAAARVLFADEDRSKQAASSSVASSNSTLSSASSSLSGGSHLPSSASIGHKKTHSRGGSYSQSNLALAPPITPDSAEGSTLVQIQAE
ncbi:hypothetical protein IAR50_003388 [Cryptococcus sp. DSM 104548]